MMRKNYTPWQRIVIAARDVIKLLAECNFNCPGCGSSNTSGSFPESWVCHNCGASGSMG